MKPIRILTALALLAACSASHAATYSVGAAGGCTHFSLADAITAASANASGPHLIKMRAGEIMTGGVLVDDPLADITIEGGYDTCASTAPTAGARMVIRQINPARVLHFINASDTRRRLILRNITLTGGNEGISNALGGGGALVVQNASLTLAAGAIVEENRAGNGGGVSLFGTDSRTAELVLTEDAVIRNNTADGNGALGNGGGVFAFYGSDVRLLHGRIERNTARRAGGGIALGGATTRLLVLPMTEVNPLATVILFFNQAGRETFSTGEGFGGAIYSNQANITISGPSLAKFATYITDNRGNYGGAIYAEGASTAADPFTFISMRNTYIYNNQAIGKGGAFHSRNAVDWILDHNAPANQRCSFSGRSLPCSVVRQNGAFNVGTTGSPGGGVGYIFNDTGSPRGIFRFSRTLFEANADYNGEVAVAMAFGTSEMQFERCIFVGNEADVGTTTTMLANAPGINLRFVYNTVLDNEVDTLFYMNGGVFRAQGSILWSPGTQVWTQTAGATIDHNACLISHEPVPGSNVVYDPKIGGDFVPAGSSPAIDYCDDDVVVAQVDALRGAPGHDAGGVFAVWGNNDLGAVENRDVLFFNGFGSRFTQ